MTLTTDEGPVVYDYVWSSSEQKPKKKDLKIFTRKKMGRNGLKTK